MEILITEGQLKKIIEQATTQQKPINQTYTTVQNRVLTSNTLTGSNITIPKGTRFTAHQNGDKKLTTPTYTASVDRVEGGKIKPSTTYYCNGKNAGKFWNSSANGWFYDKTKVLSGYLDKNLCFKSFGDQSYWEAKKIDIKGQRTPVQIANFLKTSNTLDDDEPAIEQAFSEIKTWDRYNLVKKYLGQDPYKFVSDFIDVREKHGPLQSVTSSYALLSKDATGVGSGTLTSKDCTIVLTAQKPGGPKQYLGAVNYMKFFKGSVGTPGADPLLYKQMPYGTYAKVPSDFGWKLNNSIYPYPKYYSEACLDSARQNSGFKQLEKQDYSKGDSETTQVRNQIPGKQLNFKNPLSLNEDNNQKNTYKTMQDFNQSLSKQKELIPKFCKTPLERQSDGANGSYKLRMISMYNLCKDYGGLWVYGAGTGTYTCGCRDNSNPALTTAIKTDTGNLNVSKEIQGQQGSTNWGNVDSRSILWGAAALASAFIPVVGPFVAAGIGLGGAADLWTSNKKKEAAITAFFSLLPFAGKIPGVGSIGKSLAQELKVAVLEGGALTEQQLNTLMKIIKYDEQVSKAIIPAIESQGMSKVQSHVIKTAIKETEKKVVDLANEKLLGGNLPTYGDLKKAAIKSTVADPMAKVVSQTA